MRVKKHIGFTLIELLAVIVILAIVVLITMPIILGIIEKSKEHIARDSAYMYIDAIENAFLTQTIQNGNSQFDGDWTLNEQGNLLKEDIQIPISVKGNRAIGGVIKIQNGIVQENSQIIISGYHFEYIDQKFIIYEGPIIEQIQLEKSQVTLYVGDSYKNKVTIFPENASLLSIHWSSSDSNIVSVNNQGKIIAKSVGEATIIASSSNGVQASIKVKVIGIPKEGLRDYFDFSNPNNGFISYSGTPIYTEEGVQLNNAAISTVDNYDLSTPFSIILNFKNIKYEEQSFYDNAIFLGIGTMGNYSGEKYVGFMYHQEQIFVSNGVSDATYIQVPANTLMSNNNQVNTITITHDGTIYTLYINGEKLGTSEGYSIKTSKLYIGGMPGSTNLSGTYKSLAIYNRALTEDEVTNIKG